MLGMWGLADCIECVSSGQGEYLKGHKSYLNFSSLTWLPGQEWLHLKPRSLFQQLITQWRIAYSYVGVSLVVMVVGG